MATLKSTSKIPTLIRIDESLYNDIRYYANKYNRSINKQIEYILKVYVENEDRLEDSDDQQYNKNHTKKNSD